LWSFEAGGVFVSTAIIAGDNIIVGSLDRNIYALDKSTGAEKWRHAGDKWFWASPTLFGGQIFAPNTDGKVYVMDAASGAETAVLDLGDSIASTPVIVGARVVVVTEGGAVSAIDAASRQVREVANLETTMRASLSAAGDIVYLHSQNNETVFALNAVTGARLWEFRIP
jgi:outer membrane protein assembly factor BamB